MIFTTRATVRQCERPDTLYRVFVGNWAFPFYDFGFHDKRTANRIKKLYDQGDLKGAIEESST